MTHPLLAHEGLYAITDGPRADLIEVCAAAIEGGATLLQYRDKTDDAVRRLAEASALAALCARHGVPLIVNDDVELAAAIGAAGVHLGEARCGHRVRTRTTRHRRDHWRVVLRLAGTRA